MNISEEAFDEQYDTERNRLFELLCNSTSFHYGALRIFSDCFRGEQDKTKHGPIFWALMVKGIKDTKRVVLGSLLRIYLQYYYHYCVQSSHRPLDSMKRQLDLSSMWFMVCAASFPFDQASNEFHKWRIENNQDLFDNLVIERVNFLRFFWCGTLNQFSFIGAWKIIDKLWNIWDSIDPVRILGFDTLSLSRELLHHCHQEGAFLFRFSSEGGLAVDYYNKGTLKQYHWKSESLDLHHFLTLLHNPTLQYLVTISKQNELDDQGVPVLYPKATLFQTVSIPEESIKRYEQTIENLQAINKQQEIDFRIHIRTLQETITQKEEQYKSISIKLKEQKKTEEAMEVTTQKNLNLIQDILTKSETIAALEKQVTEFKQKVQSVEATIKNQERELKDLKEALIQKDNHANKLKEAYNGKEQQYDSRVKEKNLLLEENNQFNLWLTEAVREVYEGNPNVDSEVPKDTKGKINLLTEKIKMLNKSIQNMEDTKNEKNQTLENELHACQYSIQDLERRLELKEEYFKDTEHEFHTNIRYQKLENEYKVLEGDIQEKAQIIQHLEEDLKSKKNHEEQLEQELNEVTKIIKTVEEKDKQLIDLNTKCAEFSNEKKLVQQELNEGVKKIKNLEQMNQFLEKQLFDQNNGISSEKGIVGESTIFKKILEEKNQILEKENIELSERVKTIMNLEHKNQNLVKENLELYTKWTGISNEKKIIQQELIEANKTIKTLEQNNQNLVKENLELNTKWEMTNAQLSQKHEDKNQEDLKLTEAIRAFYENPENVDIKDKIKLLIQEIERLKKVMTEKEEELGTMKEKIKNREGDITSFLEEYSLAIHKIQKKEALQRSLIQDEKNHLLHEKELLNLLLIDAINILLEDSQVHEVVIPKDTKGRIGFLIEKIKEHLENDKHKKISQVADLEDENKKKEEQIIQNLKNDLESKELLINSLSSSKNSEKKTDSKVNSEENSLTPPSEELDLREKVSSLSKSLEEKDKSLEEKDKSLEEKEKELEVLREYRKRLTKVSQKSQSALPFI